MPNGIPNGIPNGNQNGTPNGIINGILNGMQNFIFRIHKGIIFGDYTQLRNQLKFPLLPDKR